MRMLWCELPEVCTETVLVFFFFFFLTVTMYLIMGNICFFHNCIEITVYLLQEKYLKYSLFSNQDKVEINLILMGSLSKHF